MSDHEHEEIERNQDMEWLPQFISDAAKEGVQAGHLIPKCWIEGIHFKLDIHNKLEHDEFVVVGRSDGSHTLGRLKPPKHETHEWFQLNLSNTTDYCIDLGKGLKKEVEKAGIGKLHPAIREIIATKGDSKTAEEVCEELDETKLKLVKMFSHHKIVAERTAGVSRKASAASTSLVRKP